MKVGVLSLLVLTSCTLHPIKGGGVALMPAGTHKSQRRKPQSVSRPQSILQELQRQHLAHQQEHKAKRLEQEQAQMKEHYQVGTSFIDIAKRYEKLGISLAPSMYEHGAEHVAVCFRLCSDSTQKAQFFTRLVEYLQRAEQLFERYNKLHVQDWTLAEGHKRVTTKLAQVRGGNVYTYLLDAKPVTWTPEEEALFAKPY